MQTKITNIYTIIMLTLFLLFPGFEGFEKISNYKSILFYALFGALILALIISAKLKSSEQNIAREQLHAPQFILIAYCFLSIISWALCPNRMASLLGMSRNEGLVTILIYAAIFMIVYFYGNANQTILLSLCIGTILFSIIAFLQFLGFNPFSLFPEGYNYYDANVAFYGIYVSTLGNGDIASAFLCPAVAALFVSLFRTQKKMKLLCGLSFLLGIIVLFKIDIKSGILGFVLSIFLLMPFILHLNKHGKKQLMIIIVVIIVLALLFIFLVDFDITMFHEMHEIMHGHFDPSYGTGRIKIWKAVIERIPERPLFGHGPDTMLSSSIEPWHSYSEEYDVNYFAYIDAAHNEYLNVAYHQGIPAMLCYIALIFICLYNALKKDIGDEKIIITTYVLAYAIQAFFNISMCISSAFFWIALGLLAQQSTITNDEKKHNNKKSRSR